MSKTDYSFGGLDDWMAEMSRIVDKLYPVEFKRMVRQVAFELQKTVKKNTPCDTGHLRDSWKVGDIVKKGDTYYIEVYTNVDYAEAVEYGHRTKKGKGFVPGAHMMQIALDDIKARLPDALKEWLSDFIAEND